jgi:hypothetical protein
VDPGAVNDCSPKAQKYMAIPQPGEFLSMWLWLATDLNAIDDISL